MSIRRIVFEIRYMPGYYRCLRRRGYGRIKSAWETILQIGAPF